MRVLLWMQWFDPEPQIKGLAFAKNLQNLGNEVEVLTGFPNYPGGKIYPGYSIKFFQEEYVDNIRIIRVPLYPSHSSSVFGRILNYSSFGFASFLAGIFIGNNKDVIYACGPPVTVGIGAVLVSYFRKIPLVYDIQDLWPDSLAATQMFKNPFGLNIISKLTALVYKRAKHLIVQSPGIKAILISRGVNPKKISVIYNWCDESNLKSTLHLNTKNINARLIDTNTTSFNVIFAGNMGSAQGLNTILEVAQLIELENLDIRFYFIGEGIEVPKLKKIAEELNISNVLFLPRVEMDEIGNVLKHANVLLIHLKDDPLFRITIPAKTQFYMAIGKPILMAVTGDAANLITEAKAGILALPSNPRSIADKIMQMARMNPKDLDELGFNGYNFYISTMSLDIGTRKFMDIFHKCVYTSDGV